MRRKDPDRALQLFLKAQNNQVLENEMDDVVPCLVKEPCYTRGCQCSFYLGPATLTLQMSAVRRSEETSRGWRARD